METFALPAVMQENMSILNPIVVKLVMKFALLAKDHLFRNVKVVKMDIYWQMTILVNLDA